MKRAGRIAAMLAFVAFAGCSDDSPEGTVTTFLEACAEGDRDGALACLVAAERSGEGFSFDAEGAKRGFTVGSATIAGDRATVPVTSETHDQEMPFVLLREGNAWKISLEETMRQMLGVDFGELEESFERMAEQMAEGMEEAMKEMAEGMAEAMKEGPRPGDG